MHIINLQKNLIKMIKKIIKFIQENTWIKPLIFSILIFTLIAMISQGKTIPFIYSIFD